MNFALQVAYNTSIVLYPTNIHFISQLFWEGGGKKTQGTAKRTGF